MLIRIPPHDFTMVSVLSLLYLSRGYLNSMLEIMRVNDGSVWIRRITTFFITCRENQLLPSPC